MLAKFIFDESMIILALLRRIQQGEDNLIDRLNFAVEAAQMLELFCAALSSENKAPPMLLWVELCKQITELSEIADINGMDPLQLDKRGFPNLIELNNKCNMLKVRE